MKHSPVLRVSGGVVINTDSDLYRVNTLCSNIRAAKCALQYSEGAICEPLHVRLHAALLCTGQTNLFLEAGGVRQTTTVEVI